MNKINTNKPIALNEKIQSSFFRIMGFYRKIGAVSKIASTGWFKEPIECDSTIKLE